MLLEGHEQVSYGVDFSPDSHYLITGSYDQTFKQWNLKSGVNTLTFHGFEEVIYSTQFISPQKLFIGTADGVMRYFNFE